MTRIDASDEAIASLQEEVSSLKKQARKSSGRMRRFFVRLAIIAALIAGCGTAGAYVFARAGLPSFEALTRIVYTEPQPTYVVQPASLSDISKKLSYAAARYAAAGGKGELMLELSEGEMTALVRQAIVGQESAAVDEVQIAVPESDLEIFAHLTRPYPLFVTVAVKPRIEGGNIRFDLTRLRVGQLIIPASWGTGAVRLTAEPVIRRLIDTFGEYGELSRVELGAGTLTLYARPR